MSTRPDTYLAAMDQQFGAAEQWLDQAAYQVRCEWGPTGAAAVPAEVAVVVDVLSFTTTLTVAVERGIEVLPFRWRDDRAREHARSHDAVLAVGRLEARDQPGEVSLSPASLGAVTGIERLVLPSPNGSSICFGLVESGAEVVGACLRNASAVARWLAARVAGGASAAVVPAGERWRSDDSLRPAVEDLWGAGAVLAALLDLGVTGLSPEARVAVVAWRDVAGRIGAELAACASGVELAEAGFGVDVEVAAQVDVSETVAVLRDGVFVVAEQPR